MNILSSALIKIAVVCFGISLLITDFAMAKETQNQSVETSHTSKWGPDDEIGAMNYLTPETVLSASKLVTKGKVYSLGMVVESETPAFRHRYFHIETMQPEPKTFGDNKFTYVDDQIIGWTGVGSQLNGLAHYGRDNIHYNGHQASDFMTIKGVKNSDSRKCRRPSHAACCSTCARILARISSWKERRLTARIHTLDGYGY